MSFDQAGIWTEPRNDLACAVCSSPLIQPLEWSGGPGGDWKVLIRCPECSQVEDLTLTSEQAQAFRDLLAEVARGLEETADMLDLQVFRETWKPFAQALQAGHIQPMDF